MKKNGEIKTGHHFHTPTYAHNGITCHAQTSTLLHISVINHHPLGDVNTKEYIILEHNSHMYSVKI